MKSVKYIILTFALVLGAQVLAQALTYLSPIDVYEYPEDYDCEVLHQEVKSYASAIYKLDSQSGQNILEGQRWFEALSVKYVDGAGLSHDSVSTDLIKLRSYLGELRIAKDSIIDSATEMNSHFVQDLLEDCAYEEGLVLDDPKEGEVKVPGAFYFTYLEAIGGAMKSTQETNATEIQKQMYLLESAIQAFEPYESCELGLCPVLDQEWGRLFARKGRGLKRVKACNEINHYYLRLRFCKWESESFLETEGFTSLSQMCQNLKEPSEQTASACFDL